MRPEDVQLGMRVRVRDWDDMVAEATACEETDEKKHVWRDRGTVVKMFGGIPHECAFTYGMRDLCGKEFYVLSVNGADNFYAYAIHGLQTGYIITPWMVSPVDTEEVTFDGSIDELFDFLGNEEKTI